MQGDRRFPETAVLEATSLPVHRRLSAHRGAGCSWKQPDEARSKALAYRREGKLRHRRRQAALKAMNVAAAVMSATVGTQRDSTINDKACSGADEGTSKMPHQLGIELLTVQGLGPVEHVTLAADLGCTAISIGLVPPSANPHNYALWSLREDPVLRRELKAALRDRGVAISTGEGLDVSTKIDASQRAADMDMLADLGVFAINAGDMGIARGRAFDQMAVLCEMARERGMDFSVAFSPLFTLSCLADALDAVRHIGEHKASVLIDTMHFFRSGGTVRQIAELDPPLIGHVKISDAPRKSTGDYRQESMTGRMIPGEGDLPLREFVDALPRGKVLGLEVPLIAAAQSGRAVRDYTAEIVTRTRELLA